MEEQPPTEPPRRRPEPKSTRGSGRTRAAFTPPPEPDPEPSDEAPKAPRPRTRRTPPAVLFQPPTEAEARPQSTGSAIRPPAFSSPGAPGQGAKPQNPPEPDPRQAEQPAGPAPDALETGDPTPTGQDAVTPALPNETIPPGQGPAPAARRKTAGKKVTGPAEATGPAKKVAAKKTTAKKTTAAKTTAAKKTTAKKTTAETAAAKKTTGKAPAVRKATATHASVDAAPPPPPSAAPTTPTGPADRVLVPEGVAVLPSGGGEPDRPAGDRTGRSGRSGATARHILDHPGYAPEFLALAAVRELGPGAQAWAAQVRTSYPVATADGLARLATRRYVRLSAVGGALSMATGLLAPFAELAVVTWAQASLVLHLAAAHDHDPTAPDRAADLLVLTRVHPDRQSAEAALDAAEAALRGGPDGSSPRLAEAGWRLGAPIGARSANWLALRLAVRRMPGATTLVTALANSAATERLAARATTLYRTTATAPRSAGPSSPAGAGPQAGPPELPYSQSNQLRGSSA